MFKVPSERKSRIKSKSCPNLINTVFLDAEFPAESLRHVLLGGVLLHLCHIVVSHSHLDRRRASDGDTEAGCEGEFMRKVGNLVHPVLLHTELPPVSVRRFGSLFLLLHLLVLLGDPASELGNTERIKDTDTETTSTFGTNKPSPAGFYMTTECTVASNFEVKFPLFSSVFFALQVKRRQTGWRAILFKTWH